MSRSTKKNAGRPPAKVALDAGKVRGAGSRAARAPASSSKRTPTPQRPRIFISYSSKNRAAAKKLALCLRKHGMDPWWDYELLGGQDFRSHIEAQLRAATAVVVIWSPTAATSRFVIEEADMALDEGKLVTTHVYGFDVKLIPFGFRQLQSIPVGQRQRLVRSLERFECGQLKAAA